MSGCGDCRSRWRSGWRSCWDSRRSGPGCARVKAECQDETVIACYSQLFDGSAVMTRGREWLQLPMMIVMPNFNCTFFRSTRGPSEEPSPPAPDQESPEAAWESSWLFPGCPVALPYVSICCIACWQPLFTSPWISPKFNGFTVCVFEGGLVWLSDATAAKYYHIVPWLNDLMWHMGGCSVQSWMYHACPCVCKLRPCNCLPKGNENNQTSPAVE